MYISINIDEINAVIKEEWKIIEGYVDTYIITELGNVYCYRDKDSKRGWQGLHKLSLKGLNNPNRYLQVCLSNKGVVKYEQVHRLVGKYFVDGYFEGAIINHKDRNIHNNKKDNLEWITQKENIALSYSILDQTRNYKMWKLIYPDGHESEVFKGGNIIKKFIEDNNLNTSFTSLRRHGKSRGYKLISI